AFLQQYRGVGDAGETADARADQRAGRTALFFTRGVPVGVVERLPRCRHRENDEIVDLALVLGLHPLVGIEGAVGAIAARNEASDLARQIGDVKRVDLPRAACSTQDPRPGGFDATAEWRHHAEACDDNPSHMCNSSPNWRPATRNRSTAFPR